MKIVGVGAGPGMITFEAASAIKEARRIYGSARAIELASEHIDQSARVLPIDDFRELGKIPDDAVVLSTGDPMLGGLGFLDGVVIPGISSMQVACARLGISLLKVMPISLHGRRMDEARIAGEIEQGISVFLLTDETSDIQGICRFLVERGLCRDVAVLTDLGYPTERIEMGDTTNPPEASGLFCVLIGELDTANRI